VRHCPTCGSNYPDAIAFCPTDGSATQLPGRVAGAQDSLLGFIIADRYRIEEQIGDGGMGVVYRATHVVLKKAFAIKVMRGERAHDPEIVQRFVQEARAASAIGHPNIVNISDVGTTTDGAVYLVMEFLAGETLAHAMSAGPLAYARALDIFAQIAGALEATHERGIVHRDLKPENVFLKREPDNPDFVKVLDFGIAKVRNAAAKITRTGMVFGTPHYMSPEQAAGQPVDHRSDIYSLGVMMYQGLAGELPFDAESFMEIMTKHMYEPPRLPSHVARAWPHALEALIMQSLQKKPEDRPQSMRDVQVALQRVQLLGPASQPAPAVVHVQRAEPPMGVAPVRTLSARDISLAISAATAPPTPVPTPVSVANEYVPSPTAVQRSPTLTAAAEHTIVSDDDDSIAVPKLRRPVWVWVVAVTVIAGIAALTFGVSQREAAAPEADAVGGEVPPPALEIVPVAPAVVPQPTAAELRVHAAPAPATPAVAAPVRAAPAAQVAPRRAPVAVTPRHEAQPAVRKKPAASGNTDPWR
jgi:serine/threonine protein kinase